MDKKGLLFYVKWSLRATGLLLFLFTLIHGRAGFGMLLACAGIIASGEFIFNYRKNHIVNPYFLMLLSPIMLINYSSIGDFQIRLFCFLLLAILISAAHSEKIKKFRLSLLHVKPFVIWFIALAIFFLAAVVLTVQGVHLSGDEPHYIMITQSIVEDGDFDLRNNMEEKTYRKYIPVDIRFHGGTFNGKRLSFHMPGVSFLLVPFYPIFDLIDGVIPPQLYWRLVAAVINAFFAFGLFYLLKSFFPEKDISGFWLFFLIVFPLIFHSLHLYPELPAAMMMMYGFMLAFLKKRKYLLSGLLLSMIPWFHVKYYPPLALLGIVILYDLVKRKDLKRLVHFLIFPILSLALLLIYCKSLYGSFNPANIFPQEDYLSVSMFLRVKIFFAYFLDQRDGLLFYSPIFFLLFFGVSRDLKHRHLLLWISVSYVLFHAFTTIRGAHAPAGRPLIFVCWIFILFVVNYYYCWEGKTVSIIFKLLMGASFFVLVWLIYYPLFMYQPVFYETTQGASKLLSFMGSNTIDLPRYFPSFLSQAGFNPVNFIWVFFLLAIVMIHYFWPGKRVFSQKWRTVHSFGLFMFFMSLLCLYPHVHLIRQNRFSSRDFSFFNNSKNFAYVAQRKVFRIKAGNNYDIFFETGKPGQAQLTFHFLNTESTELIVRNGKRLLFQSQKEIESRFSLQLSKLKKFKVMNKAVVHIGIETRTAVKNSFLYFRIE